MCFGKVQNQVQVPVLWLFEKKSNTDIVIRDCSEERVKVVMLFLYRIVIKASASPSRKS